MIYSNWGFINNNFISCLITSFICYYNIIWSIILSSPTTLKYTFCSIIAIWLPLFFRARDGNKKSLAHKVRQGRLYNRVTTLIRTQLTHTCLTEFHQTPAAITGEPVAALRKTRSVRNSGTMFTRTHRAPFPLSGAHCAVPFGLLFPSLSLWCEVVM